MKIVEVVRINSRHSNWLPRFLLGRHLTALLFSLALPGPLVDFGAVYVEPVSQRADLVLAPVLRPLELGLQQANLLERHSRFFVLMLGEYF